MLRSRRFIGPRGLSYFSWMTLMLAASSGWTQETTDQAATSDYVSAASRVVGEYQPSVATRDANAMATAAQQLLATLTPGQLERIRHELTSDERREWTNLPARADAGGLRFGDLNESQLQAACQLLATVMSDYGYQKMCHIMLADDQLLNQGQPRPGFGTENFSLVIFGNPAVDEPWGLQLDGHHIGLNLSFQGDRISMSPSFIGTQPQAFTIGGRQFRPLAGEVDDAYALVNSLSDEQRKLAVISSRRGNIVTGPGRDGQYPQPSGLPCKTFTPEQRQLLQKLISHWVNVLPETHSVLEREQLEKSIEEIHFTWNGALVHGSDISYAIQGPALIIEYACQGNANEPLEHLHSMYRNPQNEYGGQLDK